MSETVNDKPPTDAGADVKATAHPSAQSAAAGSDVARLNARIRKRQQLILGGLGGVLLLAGSAYVFSGPDTPKSDDQGRPQTIETGGLVNRDLAQREFVAMYDNQLQDLLRQQQTLGVQVSATGDVAKQLDALKAENQQMRANGQAAIDAVSAENDALRQEIEKAKREPVTQLPPGFPSGNGSRSAPGALGGIPSDPAALASASEIKTLSFSSDKVSASVPRTQRADTPTLIVEDSPDYLPPNSYAPARVIVGVDDRAPAPAARPNRVSLTGLTTNGAIHWGPQTGPKVIILSDFHCSYCKKLEGELEKVGARVEERPISIFGKESRALAEAVLCAFNPAAALKAAYQGQALRKARACDTSGLDANEAFARKHRIAGTPVLIRADGTMLEGYRPASVIAAFLKAGSTPAADEER